MEIRIRNGLENIRLETANNKERVKIILNTVYILSRATYENPERFKKFPYFSIAFKNFIKQNHKSKLRMKLRNQANNFDLQGSAIRQLFAHSNDDFDEYADMPSLLDVNSAYNRDFLVEFIRNNRNSTNLERDFMNYFVNNIQWS